MVRALFLAALAAFPGLPARAAPVIAKAPGIVSTETLPRKPGTNEDIVIITPTGGSRKLALRGRATAAMRPPPLPLFANLLDLGSTHIFGNDRHCQVSQSGGKAHLRCRPGVSVSGMRLSFEGFRMPKGAMMDLQVSASGGVGFRAEVTGSGADARSPRSLHSGSALRLPLPDLSDSVPPQLVIAAPKDGGELIINGLELVAASARAINTLSAWVWDPALWRSSPSGLIASARNRGIERLFITLEVEDGKVRHRKDLRRFIRLAARAGVEVEAVEGDPHMVSPGGLDRALIRARAFADYQRDAGRPGRLAGIQYDVEPYALAEWGQYPASYRGWADAILQLSAAAGEPIDLVLPFWVLEGEEGREFLRRASPATRGLTIMSYRTRPSSLAQIAEPLLAWGAAEAKPVRLALEAGPVADEVEQVFREAPIGTLAVLPGSEPRIAMLDKPSTIKGARMFELHEREIVRGDRISFLGDENAMMELALRTAPAFSAWPSFAGFALHGLGWPADAKMPAAAD